MPRDSDKNNDSRGGAIGLPPPGPFRRRPRPRRRIAKRGFGGKDAAGKDFAGKDFAKARWRQALV